MPLCIHQICATARLVDWSDSNSSVGNIWIQGLSFDEKGSGILKFVMLLKTDCVIHNKAYWKRKKYYWSINCAICVTNCTIFQPQSQFFPNLPNLPVCICTVCFSCFTNMQLCILPLYTGKDKRNSRRPWQPSISFFFLFSLGYSLFYFTLPISTSFSS